MKKKFLIIFLLVAGIVPAKSQKLFNYDSLSAFNVLQTGLETNFNIKMKKQIVGESQGQLARARGFFNPSLSLTADGMYGTDPAVTVRNSSTFSGQLLVPTRLGLKFYTGFKLFTETQIISGVPEVFPSTYMPVNESGMWAGVSMPLMRDLGRNNSGNISYLSTLMMNKAQNVAFTDEVCQFIKNALTSYYTSYQRVTVYKILRDADKDARQYRSDIQAMIADEQLAKTEDYRATAYQLNISQQLSAARNDIYNSLFDLISALSVKGIKNANTLPVYLDSLPDPLAFPWSHYAAYIMKNVDSMVVSTPYFKSQELVTSSSRIEMDGAKYNKLNELNLDLRYLYFGSTAYQPFSEFSQTFSNGSPGSSVNVTLSYKIPFKNEERKGEYLTKLSSYEFNKTQLEKIKFESRLQVVKIISDLGQMLPMYKSQVEIADVEKKTYLNEVSKFKMGVSTQIDMINTYMDYKTALVNVENGRLGIISRILELKYLIGDFPSSTDQLAKYNPWTFITK